MNCKYIKINSFTVLCFTCKETFDMYQDEYHLQIPMDGFELQQTLMEMQMSTVLDDYNCPQYNIPSIHSM